MHHLLDNTSWSLMTDSGISWFHQPKFFQPAKFMKAKKKATINIEGSMYTRASSPKTRFAPREMDGNKHKNNRIKLKGEVGMEGHKSIVGVIRYMWNPYFFSLKYHHLKRSRDVTYTLLLLSVLLCPSIPISPFNFIQLFLCLYTYTVAINKKFTGLWSLDGVKTRVKQQVRNILCWCMGCRENVHQLPCVVYLFICWFTLHFSIASTTLWAPRYRTGS